MQSEEVTGKLAGTTRRSFIRGIAAAGAAAYTLDRAGVGSLLGATAHADGRGRFAAFDAIAASAADRVEVPAGFRADVLIAWGDQFADTQGNVFEFGFNCDFLAYFPLKGSKEGILFINHEYPGPFYQYGFKPDAAGVAAGKTFEQVEIERKSVGNSILHVERGRDGIWRVVSPSRYNTRVYGGQVAAPEVERSLFSVTGPVASDPRVGRQIWGSVGNCSGGITPWGTAISCEENFDGYGQPLTVGIDFFNGWFDEAGHEEYLPGEAYRPGSGNKHAKYGWVCEHDPYDPSSRPRKHTALGRFRHENTAYRAARGKKFVIYMGDDKNNEGVYKFVSDRSYHPRDRANNLKILEAGTLYIAKWYPEGRRRFANSDGTGPLTPPSGTGEWVEVSDGELIDTATLLRARFGADYDKHFATNRPEDVEVDPKTGDVYIAFTNNTGRTGTNDVHGAVRRLQEAGNDPEKTAFTWEDYANGGPTGRTDPGEQGFSCVDNLVFDKRNDLWIVTDISTSSLNVSTALKYHANNAMFYVPTDEDPEDRIAYRFANMPREAEGTGPYFTPDEDTLFVNVQHPGELANVNSTSVFGQPATYTSYWPDGENTPGAPRNPSTPKPSTVVITRPKRFVDGMNLIPRPAGFVEPQPPRGDDSDSDSDDRGRDSDSDSD